MATTAKKDQLVEALFIAQKALSLIASAKPPAGPHECNTLASDALEQMAGILNEKRTKKDTAPAEQAPTMVADGALINPRKPISVYTDGGCHGNPGPAGWGAVVVQDGLVVLERNAFIGVATNQVAELTAAIQGLAATPVGTAVELISDSQYVLKGISEWRKGWVARGWLTSTGHPVANKALWVALYAEVDKRKVTTRWVRGHSGNIFNERCDVLATEAITAGKAKQA